MSQGLAGDNISVHLVSTAGKEKAQKFQQQQYPLASRHFSIRAGFILEQALQLLNNNDFAALTKQVMLPWDEWGYMYFSSPHEEPTDVKQL